MSKYSEENWEKLERRFPNIKNLFELQIVKMRLFGYPQAFVKINVRFDILQNPVLVCQILKEKQWKIFSFHYNTVTNKMFIRNQLDESKHLVYDAHRIYIESMEQLDLLISKTIAELEA